MSKNPQDGFSTTPPAHPLGEKIPVSTSGGSISGDGSSGGGGERKRIPPIKRPRGLSSLDMYTILPSAGVGGFGPTMEFSREKDAAKKEDTATKGDRKKGGGK